MCNGKLLIQIVKEKLAHKRGLQMQSASTKNKEEKIHHRNTEETVSNIITLEQAKLVQL